MSQWEEEGRMNWLKVYGGIGFTGLVFLGSLALGDAVFDKPVATPKARAVVAVELPGQTLNPIYEVLISSLDGGE